MTAPLRSSDTSTDVIRVVLVDDHTIVRQGLRGVLQALCGVKVVGEAENGEHALAVVAQTQPQVVLMDVNMPKMNGIEATKRIVQSMPHVRVLGLSMHDTPEVRSQMIEAGAAGYMAKTVEARQMCQMIRMAVGGGLGG